MSNYELDFYRKTLILAKRINNDINPYQPQTKNSFSYKNNIYLGLEKVSEALAQSYLQIKNDIDDSDRISWAGTAHEIRQIISSLLIILAPDEEVIAQSWYKKPEDGTSTQKQKVRYILEQKGAGSKETDVVEQISSLDEVIQELVRKTYSRASDAAHRFKNRNEVIKILRYFDAFILDLLDIT